MISFFSLFEKKKKNVFSSLSTFFPTSL